MIRILDSIATRLAGARTVRAVGDAPPRMLMNRMALAPSGSDGVKIDMRHVGTDTNLRVLRYSALEEALEGALHKGELFLHYQPQASLSSGRIVAVEALLRWTSPEFGAVPPDVFIPLAEKTGLIVRIGEWVLREACAQNRAWQRSGLPPIKMAVNLSSRQLCEGNLASLVERILDDTRLAPALLELELTEGRAIHDTEHVTSTLRTLRAMGVTIALDDFGTGYASLTHLRRFSIDTIKIDRSFVRNIGTDPEGAVIVEGILAIARGLRLRVVGEGVETEAELAYLRDHDCDHVQGFLTGRPVLPSEIAHLLRAGGAVCRGRFMAPV